MLLLVLLLLCPTAAFAYVDPNTGGWLYNILFPVGVALAAAWGRLRLAVAAWWRNRRKASRE